MLCRRPAEAKGHELVMHACPRLGSCGGAPAAAAATLQVNSQHARAALCVSLLRPFRRHFCCRDLPGSTVRLCRLPSEGLRPAGARHLCQNRDLTAYTPLQAPQETAAGPGRQVPTALR